MIVESPPPVPGQWLWFSTCFPLVDFPTKKIYRKKKYYVDTFHLSSCMVYVRREFPKYFQHKQKHIRFTGQSVLVNGKLTPEWGNRTNFSISICFGVGARETRLPDNMTLGWKTERSARTNTKMLSTKQATDRSIDSFASCRTPKCEDFYKCHKTSLNVNILPQMWK